MLARPILTVDRLKDKGQHNRLFKEIRKGKTEGLFIKKEKKVISDRHLIKNKKELCRSITFFLSFSEAFHKIPLIIQGSVVSLNAWPVEGKKKTIEYDLSERSHKKRKQ